jgi:hypothetical protein
MSNINRDLGTMNYHTVLFISLIALQSILSGCSDQQNPGASEATNDKQEVQQPSKTDAINAIQKPSEAEAILAAVIYLNRDGKLSIKDTEFIAWGTYSEQQAYWPMKLRMAYKTEGYDDLRHNEYAVKISKDANGKWKAGQYYAWRTDFKE